MLKSMKTNIDGPSSPYSYNISIISGIEENNTFIEFELKIFNLKTTLIGSNREKFEIWFTDLSVIKDRANNSLKNTKMYCSLNKFEYLSAEAEDATRNGGSSMKYAIVSMFSINMLLKIAISTSAALMWSLINVLQVFRYILMINTDRSRLISIFMTYLEIVIGEFDELENFTPDLLNKFIVDSDSLNKNIVIFDRFEENGYESPLLTDLYGKQFTMLLCFTFVIIPLIYILKRA